MRLWFVLAFSIVSGGLALADMVPPMMPIKCATGSYATQDHDYTYCRPTSCQKNEDCEKGQECQPQGLCIVFSERYGRPGNLYIHESAGDACSSKKACSYGECETIKRCVPKGTKASTDPENKLSPPVKTPKTPTPEPKTPEPQPETPESQPESAPESTPAKTPPPPTKVDKGRCSVSPVGDISGSLVSLVLFFSLLLLRRRR